LFIDRTKSTGEEKEGGDMEPQQNPYEKAITNTWDITTCMDTKKL
jgi:hypothetical protein